MGSTLAVLLMAVFWSSTGLAKIRLAPPDFDLRDGNRAVFVHFEAANYEVTFDIPQKLTKIRSVIRFQNHEAGMPVFDLVDEPQSVVIDGQPAEQELIDAPGSRKRERVQFRVAKKTLEPGSHVMEIEHELKAYPAYYLSGAVQSGFFMWDFDPRGLLERYLPANLEYDQVLMRLEVQILGAAREHLVFTNGRIQKRAHGRWSIEFPKYFNCSALYFHVRPKNETTLLQFDYLSRDGRKIPVVVYEDRRLAQDLKAFKKLLDEKLALYEKLYGAFPHPALTIYNTGTEEGAMEYSGAAFTNFEALPHELAHSYFGRGVMPANGNAGWIDEAMATFVGGPEIAGSKELQTVNMAAHSPYFRANDSTGYTYGVNLLTHLDQAFSERKKETRSMNGFLGAWVGWRLRQVITTPILKEDLERYSGKNLSDLFHQFVYGARATDSNREDFASASETGPHLPMTKEKLWQVQ